MKYLKHASVAALLVSLSACGGSSDSPPATPPPPPQPTGLFSLTGTASKGLVLGATVSITDALNPSIVLAEGSTDSASGEFLIEVLDTTNFTGAFVKITVTGDADAMMVCDSTYNCNGGVYGDPVSVDGTFSLSAIVPTPSAGTQTVNLNMLTDLTAKLTEASVGGVTATNLDGSKTRVATLFDFATTEFETIAAFTDPLSTDDNVIKLGLLSGGLLGSANDAAMPIAALNDFAADFLINAGELNVSDADVEAISLIDIYKNAGVIDPAVVDTTSTAHTQMQSNPSVIAIYSELAERGASMDIIKRDSLTVEGAIPALVEDAGGQVFHTDANGNRLILSSFADATNAIANVNALNWDQATLAVESLSLAGFDDWRLPTADEFELLYSVLNIPYPGTSWTSTEITINGFDLYANCVDSSDGFVNICPKFIPMNVIPIRDDPA